MKSSATINGADSVVSIMLGNGLNGWLVPLAGLGLLSPAGPGAA